MRQPSSLISWTQSGPFGGLSTSRQVAKGMKSGRLLTTLRPFLAGRLLSGAFPTNDFLAAFAGGFALTPWLEFSLWPIAIVALVGLGFLVGILPLIGSDVERVE